MRALESIVHRKTRALEAMSLLAERLVVGQRVGGDHQSILG